MPLTPPTCDHAIYLSIICINIPGVLSKRKHDLTRNSLFFFPSAYEQVATRKSLKVSMNEKNCTGLSATIEEPCNLGNCEGNIALSNMMSFIPVERR